MSQPTQSLPITLRDRHVLIVTQKILGSHLTLSADGYDCQTDDLFNIIVMASVKGTYIEHACRSLEDTPDSNTIRGYLHQDLTPEQIPALEQQCDHALAHDLSKNLTRRALDLAADYHDEPYYGEDRPFPTKQPSPDQKEEKKKAAKPHRYNPYICGGKPSRGTHWFYRIATLYVIKNNSRVTLAVVFVRSDDDDVTVLARLLEQARRLNLSIKCLFLDKGFGSIEVLHYLEENNIPSIVAVPIRGKTGGTKQLCRGNTSYLTEYAFKDQDGGSHPFKVAMVRTYHEQASGHKKLVWLMFACVHVEAKSAVQVRKEYRKRFGVESSYRLVEQVRAKTTSNNPALRCLFSAVSLILINTWIRLQNSFLRVAGRGPVRIARDRFPLAQMADFLIHAIEEIYGAVRDVGPPRPPRVALVAGGLIA